MKIYFNSGNGMESVKADDDIVFIDYYESGNFERYALFEVDGYIKKVNVKDIKAIEKSERSE